MTGLNPAFAPFSVSAWMNMLRARPAITLTLGVILGAAQLWSSFGPGVYAGADGALKDIEKRIILEHPELQSELQAVEVAFTEIRGLPLSDERIAYVLRAFDQAGNIRFKDVRAKPELLETTKFLFFLDCVSRDGDIEKAKEEYRGKQSP